MTATSLSIVEVIYQAESCRATVKMTNSRGDTVVLGYVRQEHGRFDLMDVNVQGGGEYLSQNFLTAIPFTGAEQVLHRLAQDCGLPRA
jgi:hypothetical protein